MRVNDGTGDRIRIGIDVGGTKIEATALDPHGRQIATQRIATPLGYQPFLGAVRSLILDVEARARQDAPELSQVQASLGFGVPGSVSPHTGIMRNANTTWLNGKDLKTDLSRVMGHEVRIENDANCLALSEALDGAAAGCPVVFAVILGTGCGGGLAVNGRLVSGGNGNAGEWGHMPLAPLLAEEAPLPDCWCGKRGCMETFVSGTGFEQDYLRVNGYALKAADIVNRLRAGDASAAAGFKRLVSRLGRGLATLVNILDPDAFVFGGGLSNIPELYEALPGAIRPYVFSDSWSARLVPAHWGDSSGVRGAAHLWDGVSAAQLEAAQ